MANGVTYGITFPFKDSFNGKFLDLTDTSEEEIKSSLIHLLLTKKGSRYFMPNFGTRIYEYIFEPLDSPTFDQIETEIKESVETYIPNLQVISVNIEAANMETDSLQINNEQVNEFNFTATPEAEYTAKVRINYSITNNVFNSTGFVIINI
jgi:phage baseplate assembly protein W